MTSPIAVNEADCIFQGVHASGAYIDDTYACIYAIDPCNARYERSWIAGVAQTWHGERVGSWVSTRPDFFGGWNRSRMRAIRLTLDDGRIYSGRYCPDNGDFVRCKRVKGKGTK